MNQALQVVPSSGAMVEKAQSEQLQALEIILGQLTPKDFIRYRPGRGGSKQAYVPHTYVISLLNKAFMLRWSFEVDHEDIKCVNDVPFEAVVRGKLTVWLPGVNEPIIKMQMGCQPIEMQKNSVKPVSLGDALKGAGSDALKKCASELGIALDLYDSEHDPRNNPTEQQMRQQSVEVEVVDETPAPVAPVQSSPDRIKLDAIIRELMKEKMGVQAIQNRMFKLVSKSQRAQLTDAECAKVAIEFDGWLADIYQAEDPF